MNARTMLMLWAAAFLALGGCATTGHVDPGKIDLAPAPAAAMIPCADPVDIPDNISDLNGAQKEALITTDRLNFVDCGRRHWLLIRYVRDQQAAFNGGGA